MAIKVTQVVLEVLATSDTTTARVVAVAAERIYIPDEVTGVSGIASAQAFGSGGTVTVLDLTLTAAAGIASAQAFGSGGDVSLSTAIEGGSGIASAEAFGDGELIPDQLLTAAAGIASQESVGAGVVPPMPSATGTSGIASAEAVGTGIVAGPIGEESTDDGIESVEAFGSGGTISSGTVTGVAGIASAEAFGSGGSLGSVGGPIDGSVVAGISEPASQFGTGTVTGPITGSAGIASAEAFGDGALEGRIRGTSGIASREAFGAGNRASVKAGLWGILGVTSGEGFGISGAVLQLPDVAGVTGYISLFATTIGSRDVSGFVKESTIRIERQLNFQSSASFDLVDEDVAYVPSVGEVVYIHFWNSDSGTWVKIFGGTVENKRVIRYGNGPERGYSITCCDFARSLGRRLVTKKYPAASYGTVSSILQDLNDTIFAAEGISWVDRGDPGVAIGDIEFSYVPVNEVLQQLANLSGWDWQVDYDRNFYFYDRPAATVTAPYTLTENLSDPWFDLEVLEDRGMYRNRQHIKANFSATTQVITKTYAYGVDESVPYQVFWNGTGLIDREYFGKLRRIISVKWNTTDLVFYCSPHFTGDPFWVAGMDEGTAAPTGWQYVQPWAYDLQLVWNIGDAVIGPTVPTSGTLTVEFEVMNDMPSSIMVEDTAEIAARRAVEGGSGVYEAVEEVVDIEDVDVLTAYAQGLLDRFKVLGIDIGVSYNAFGFEPGQDITVNLPSFGISSTTMTVESLSMSEESLSRLRTSLKITNRIQQRDALASFNRLLAKLKKPANKARDTVNFRLAETIPGMTNPGLQVGSNMTAEFILRSNFTLIDAVIFAKTANTGADAIFDILADGVSIFSSGYEFSYPAGGTSIERHTSFHDAPLTLPKDTRLTVNVTQVGSIEPGSDVSIVLSGWV